MIPLGWCFTVRRDEDEHWYDPDPVVRQRNRDWEDRLESIVPRYHAPRQEPENDMSTIWPAVVKFGIVPGAFIYMLYLTTGDMRRDVQDIKDTQQVLVQEQRQVSIELRSSTQRQEHIQGVIIDLLRAQCVNSAKDQQERGECLRAGR